ncbi:MAG: hypothetical protein ACRDTD_27455 [Pseudonocardiaceae bacterium]
MVAVLLPTGFFAGEFYTATDAEEPEYYDVRFGTEILRLDAPTYAVWALSHGDPVRMANGAEPNRLSLVAVAREAGLADIGQSLADLQELGLVVQLLPVGNQLQRFAQAHWVKPLAMGLGNTNEDLERVRIGHPDNLRISVSPLAYNVWLYSDQFQSLWDTCAHVAAQISGQAGDNAATARPDDVLNEFLPILPALIAVSCAYVDRR